MTGTKLCARAHRERNVPLTSTWFSHKLVLIDDRHDAARTELEKIVIDFAKDRFGQAVFEVHGAVRMNEIVFVVVAKERSETEAFDVEVCVAPPAVRIDARSRCAGRTRPSSIPARHRRSGADRHRRGGDVASVASQG